ncbi:hypothetical protein [Streptomyces sp. NPDC060022]|uniref:hypothetical protein n=1 Tax=Streptomyces sp. NPDC060022 TaxID=3347039 RepID=UPI0036910E58
MITEQEARAAIRHALGDVASIDIETFPAGNLSITITKGEHAATIDGHTESGWGWSIDPVEDDGFSGHENTADTLEEVLVSIHAALI